MAISKCCVRVSFVVERFNAMKRPMYVAPSLCVTKCVVHSQKTWHGKQLRSLLAGSLYGMSDMKGVSYSQLLY